MITVISGTNRPNSLTQIFARRSYELLRGINDVPVEYIDLSEIHPGILHADMYEADSQHPSLFALQEEKIIPAKKFLIVSPEYNGGYPGILKLFIDALSIREYKGSFSGKKVGLVGVATGRAGNLRGMDHLCAVFMHMGSTVYPKHLPLSKAKLLLKDDGSLNEDTEALLQSTMAAFSAF